MSIPLRISLSFCLISTTLLAQVGWESSPPFALPPSPLALIRPAQPRMPFTVAGEAGAIFGQGDGSFEAWIFPVKIASHFRITAEMEGYPIPIELSDYAATIEVNPDHTTITYSHSNLESNSTDGHEKCFPANGS